VKEEDGRCQKERERRAGESIDSLLKTQAVTTGPQLFSPASYISIRKIVMAPTNSPKTEPGGSHFDFSCFFFFLFLLYLKGESPALDFLTDLMAPLRIES
jgi:hypothetical protein